MPRAKLSPEAIDEIQYLKSNNSSQIHWDELLPGFGVRVYQSGAKVFIVKYRIAGRQFVDTLGPVELIPLEQARESARRTLIRAYNERTATSAANQRLISEFCSEYIDRYARENVQDWQVEASLCKLYIKPTWGDRPISSLRKSDVVALVDTVSSINLELADKVKTLVSRMWECGIYWQFIDEAIQNPTAGIPEVERLSSDLLESTLSERLFAAVASERNYFARAAMLFLLFSSLHKSECVQSRWSDIDWDARTITVQRVGNKQKRPFTLPLSEPAHAILQSLPRHPENPYIFCGRERGLPINDFDERWERFRSLTGVSQIKLQSLRQSVISGSSSGVLTINRLMKTLGYS